MDPRTFDADLMSEMLSAMGKELKLARAKIHSLESQDYQKRAESAEYALDVLKKNFEEVCLENRRLQAMLEEKENIEEVTPPPSPTKHSKKSVSTDPVDTKHVQDLEQALETYYRKYKSQKDSKNQLRETCRELEVNLSKIEAELKGQKKQNQAMKEKGAACKISIGVQPRSAATIPPVVPSIMTTESDIHKFMTSIPTGASSRFCGKKLNPVCGISMDLKKFLAEDPRSKDVGKNLLCLPGRLVWCPPTKQHALAMSPLYIYDVAKNSLSKNKAAFNGLYGQAFHLFYSSYDSIYYAGFYKAIDLRPKTPGGISLTPGSDLSLKTLAEATLGCASSPHIARFVSQLYQKGVLKAEALGLQCLEFDSRIYDMLTTRFASFQSTTKKTSTLGGYYPEAIQEESDQPKKKKQKIVS
ncbi:hypothetical protein BJ912DRAFT_970311 [Pholiota molesta]|nr:hypothetical protein BJ912DRAFT_970311 [Pholiota molesta]